MIKFSVVVSTYSGESADFLRESLLSIVRQTTAPNELVVVADGPIPDLQVAVVNEISTLSSFPIRFIRLPVNQGRGRARNAGIEASQFEFVALMDSDDVCVPDRFERQVYAISSNPNIDLVAGLTEEFCAADGVGGVIKSCPQNHDEIARALQWSNCVANPTIFFKKSMWHEVGGFPDYRDINEDYLFYLRSISFGAIFYCIPDVVLRVRISNEQRARRRGFLVLKSDFVFRVTAYKEGLVGFVPTILVIPLLVLRRLAPSFAGKILQRCWRFVSKFIH